MLASHSHGDLLKFLSPGAYLGSKLLGSDSSIPSAMLSALSPAARLLAANNNQPAAAITTIHVKAPHTGDP
jgi:hypothetical protein